MGLSPDKTPAQLMAQIINEFYPTWWNRYAKKEKGPLHSPTRDAFEAGVVAAIETLEATEAQAFELSNLRSEVGEWKDNANRAEEVIQGQARRIGELEAGLEDAAVALHPFALEAMEWSVSTPSDVVPACGVSPTTTPAKFTVGDLRRAAQTYAALLPHDTKEPSDDR